MATNLPRLAEIERLSPRVIRILGGNPGKFTLQGTNTYLVGRGPKRVLIDSGQGEASWASALRQVLESEGATVGLCLHTHWHPDHVRGVDDLRQIVPGIDVRKHQKSLMTGDGESWGDVADGERFVVDEARDEVDGTTLRALHCPGHTDDHMSFVLEEEGSMFTGDNVLGHGTSVFDDLGAYLRSLAKMRAADNFSGRAYPGHGEVLEQGKERMSEYIEHRRQRERQIVECMKGGDRQVWSSMEIVKVVYSDVREELHAPAEKGVRLVLYKLLEDGAVTVTGDEDDARWQLVGAPSL